MFCQAEMQPGVDIFGRPDLPSAFHRSRGSPFRHTRSSTIDPKLRFRVRDRCELQLKSRLRGAPQDRSIHGNGDKAVL
jgi:hypothetical protein